MHRQHHHKFSNTLLALLLAALGLTFHSPTACAAESTPLAAQGKALAPVVTSPDASTEVKRHAATLAEYLGKISGAQFEVKEGDGKSGLAIGIATDFPALNLTGEFAPGDPERREEYLLRSHDKGVYLIGATELAVSHAVWDLMYRLGYRHFFPGKNWEIIPSTPDLEIAVNVKEKPDFFSRRIWYGFGDWGENGPDKNAWDARNRMAMALHIRSQHTWQGIHKSYKSEFDKHPEWLMSTRPVKFCVSNPGLRKLVVDHALRYFEAKPDEDSISLEPSDGGGWDNEDGSCPDDKVYKSVTDRVVSLANEVAEAVNKKFPGKYVGIYAYYKHAPPPTIKVHPQVAVGIATAFISGGYTFEQLAEGWGKQGAMIGVRDYYSVVIGHQDRPGGPGAANFLAMPARVKQQHQLGTRFVSAESSNSWGSAGLGYYLAARTMWDTDIDTDELYNDFFEKAFGPAQQPMRDFYELIDKGNKPLFSADLIGRMYRHLDEARKLTSEPGIRGRIDDLVLYTRYVELLKNIEDLESTGKVIGHAYRIRKTHMVHSYALWRESRNWRHKRTDPDTRFNVPEDKNPWKNSAPFTVEEIDTIIREGIANNPLMDFKAVSYSKELVPATPLKLDDAKIGAYWFSRFSHHMYIWVDKPRTLELTVTAGQIGGGKTTIELYAVEDPTGEVLSTAEVQNDKQPYPIELKTPFSGLHRIEVDPGRAGAKLDWPEGTPAVFPSGPDEAVGLSHRIHMYFYVPKGTKVVGGFASSVGHMRDGDGKVVFGFSKEDFGNGNYFSIPVPPGQDGKAWSITNSVGARLFMTVPPYLARSPQELMLPKEVVEADAPGDVAKMPGEITVRGHAKLMQKDTLYLFDESILERTRRLARAKHPSVAVPMNRLRAKADEALNEGPWSVMDKKFMPPSGDKHDYMSIAIYWWPNPDTPDGLPYIWKDGVQNPAYFASDGGSGKAMTDALETLSLAYYLTGDERYAAHATRVLRTWFIDKDTRMNPHLRYAQAIPGKTDGRADGLVSVTQLLYKYPDIIALIRDSKSWSDADETAMKAWCGEFLDWIKTTSSEKNRRRCDIITARTVTC